MWVADGSWLWSALLSLDNITVSVHLPFLFLKVFPPDQIVNTLLDDWDLGLEPKHKVVVVEERYKQQITSEPTG